MRGRVVLIGGLIVLALVAACSSGAGEPTSPTEPEPPGFTLELVTDALAAPREVIGLDGGILLVSDQRGTISVIEGGELRPDPLLDIAELIRQPIGQSIELGLAGFQVAPDFATTGTFYTLTTHTPGEDAPEDATRVDTVTAWTADPATLVADPGSAVVIIEIPQDGANHVGDLAIDGDGALWIGAGAPGPASPAQDPEQWPGSLLRILPDPVAGGYTVPPDNPFVDGGGAPEVYSFGYRNIWRSTLDAELGLLLAEAMARDANQHVWLPQPADNGGYPVRNRISKTCWEGVEPVAECVEVDGVPMAFPALEYGPEIGTIISGVAVMRGEQYGAFDGQVLVSDWNGKLLAATPGESPWTFTQVELSTPVADDRYLWDLSTGADGTIYVSTTDSSLENGELWRLVLTGG